MFSPIKSSQLRKIILTAEVKSVRRILLKTDYKYLIIVIETRTLKQLIIFETQNKLLSCNVLYFQLEEMFSKNPKAINYNK